MNAALENLITRRSIRKYKPEQITEAELDAVLEAGTYAPTAMGWQSPLMVAVTNKDDIAAMSRMNAAVMGRDADPFYGASTVIVVFATATSPAEFRTQRSSWRTCSTPPTPSDSVPAGSTVPRKSLRPKRARLCSRSGASRATGSASATASSATPMRLPRQSPARKAISLR